MIHAIPYIGEPKTLPIASIRTKPQIRTRNGFDEKSLNELADTIREVGIVQPLIVCECADEPNAFDLIAGERRLLAASLAGLAEVPVVVRTVSKAEAATLQAIENLQRENLCLADTADGVAELLKHYKTPKAVAKALGKSPAWVSKHLSVTKMCAAVRAIMTEGKSEDPELLLCLDKIARMKGEAVFATFNALISGLETGKTTRESARLALTRLKTPAAPDEKADENNDESEDGDARALQRALLHLNMRTFTVDIDTDRFEKLQSIGGRDWLIAQIDKA